MNFKIGDIVKRSYDDVRFGSGQLYGKVIGFEGDLEDDPNSWVRIEGEYFIDSLGRQCINHYNPKFLTKVENPCLILTGNIKKFSFK